ncbi:MAG: hypothetical protein WCF53_02610, partial [Pseudolabrys sp.]
IKGGRLRRAQSQKARAEGHCAPAQGLSVFVENEDGWPIGFHYGLSTRFDAKRLNRSVTVPTPQK